MNKTIIKIMTVILALAMCMSLGSVAFAGDEEDVASAEIIIEQPAQPEKPQTDNTNPAPEAKTAPEAEAKSAPETETKPAPEAEAKTAPAAETKTAPEAETKLAPEAETKLAPEVEVEDKPAPAAETKTALTQVLASSSGALCKICKSVAVAKEGDVCSACAAALKPVEGTESPEDNEIAKKPRLASGLLLAAVDPEPDPDNPPVEIVCPVCHTKYTAPAGTACPNTDNHKNWNWLWYPTDPCDGVEILNKDLAAIGGNTITYTVRPTQSAYYATGVIVTDLTTGEEYNLPIEPSITGWGTVNFKVPNDTTGAQHVYTVRPVQGFSPYAAYIYGCYPLGYGCYPTSYCGRVPKTGDDANLGLWAVLMTMSAVSLAGVYFCAKKNKG